MSNLDIGRQGEEIAFGFLNAQGYEILARNYKTKLGEIDIIARENGVYCFVEVKFRNSSRFGLPQEAVSKSKQRQIIRAAMLFLKENLLFEQKMRFDVVSIMHSGNLPQVQLIKGAFESYV